MASVALFANQWVAGAASEDGNESNVLSAGNSFQWNHFGDPAKGSVLQETYLSQDISGFIATNTGGVGRAVKLIGPNQAKRVAVKVEVIEWNGAEYSTLQTSPLVNSGDAGKFATATTPDVPWGEACVARYAKTTAQERWADNRLSTTVREGPFILSPSCFFGTAEARGKKLQKLQVK